MKLIQDESERPKTHNSTLTQVWPKKGEEVATTNGNNSESDTNVDAYEYSKKLRRERSIRSKESSESPVRKSPSSKPPSTVLCSSSSVAAKEQGNESEESDPNFHTKRKRRSTSHSFRTTTTTSTSPSSNSHSKKGSSITCEACFRKDLKIADLRTKCAQLKGDRDALREKQLLVHRITSVDTEFLHSSERSGYKK